MWLSKALFAAGGNLGRLHFAALVPPGIALVCDDRGEVGVAERLERLHRGVRLALQYRVEMRLLRPSGDLGARQRWCLHGRRALPLCLVAGNAVLRIDLLA